MFKKIIVGVDFSDTSNRAMRHAAALAKPLGAQLVLVHVIAPGADYADPAKFITEIRPAIEEQLEKLKNELIAQYGVSVDWGVVDGKPAEALTTFAARWEGDLIVAGTAGKSGVERMLLGSVAERVVRTAKVPVLVVGPEAK